MLKFAKKAYGLFIKDVINQGERGFAKRRAYFVKVMTTRKGVKISKN